uniref:Uncharacterized protein n=1 Tax=Pyxicephalus adspersus TaxID=30357 RepID=A0AAV2ZYK0_PYXAD|nr:TPA: hypothetical protein GDO54_016076 [Pyxicephalus adspersus]
MELQAAGGFNLYGQEVQHLSSCGWTKLDLFDHHNQVLSGRWKLPVRGLPLRPGLSTGQLNTVPQVGKAEIYLRVVNARDAELQAMAEINPRNSSLYQYPPLVSKSHVMNVSPEEDMLLMLRFYHWPGGSTAWAPWQHRKSLQPLLANEEWIVAWTAIRLTRPESSGAETDSRCLVWNSGVHDLPLYHSPAPPALSLSGMQPEKLGEIFEQYGDARVRFYIFSKTRPDYPFPLESPAIDNDNMAAPEGAYIPHSRRNPLVEPHSPTDGITVYIDGARFLPDAATVTRVTGRIFDKNYDQFGPDISTRIDLNSDIFHPRYSYSVQIHSPNMPPTSTLLLKVYTLDRFSRELALIGWAALNLFVESGTKRAPSSDSGGIQISLNEGGHQIRLYHRSPPTERPLSAESLASSGQIVPCATLLVRIRKGKTQHQEEDPTELPEYSQGVYYSETAQPTLGEILLYKAMNSRSVVQVREVIPPLSGSAGQKMMSDFQLSDWVEKTFNERMKNSATRPFQLCCVSPYLVTSGLVTFTRRISHNHLTLIIHLHEIHFQEKAEHSAEQAKMEATSMEEWTQEFRAGSQAWTAMRVFYKNYCDLGAFQLPLYQGAPTMSVLHALRSEDCRAKLKDLERKNMASMKKTKNNQSAKCI